MADYLAGALWGANGSLLEPPVGASEEGEATGGAEVTALEEGFTGGGNSATRVMETEAAGAAPAAETEATSGWGPTDPPVRFQGPWTKADLKRAGDKGQGPLDMLPTKNSAGKSVPLELHHADQMPGSAVHEAPPFHTRTVPHPSGNVSQGVTDKMRREDTRMHWYMRGQEMGNPPPQKKN